MEIFCIYFENSHVNYIWYTATHDMKANIPYQCKYIFEKERKKDSKKKRRGRKLRQYSDRLEGGLKRILNSIMAILS